MWPRYRDGTLKLWFWRFHVTMTRATGAVYMHRWQLLKTVLLSVYINKICLSDEDPWFHTHPWRASWSMKLKNHYIEWYREPSTPRFLARIPGRFSRIPHQHRIVYLWDGKPVWTVFVGWRSDHGWGFVDPSSGEVIDWQTRARERGLPLSAFSGGNQ